MAFPPLRPQNRADQLAVRNAAQQNVFAREVDDALRQDEMLGAVRRYGIQAAIAVVALLAAVAGWLLWESHVAAGHAVRGEQLTLALDQLDAGHNGAAAAQAVPLSAGSDGVAAAARLIEAGVALGAGHRDQAVRLYAALAADTGVPQPYRDLATIRAVAASDNPAPADIIARLRPLAVPGNAWFGSAGELVGMAYLQQGRKDLAAPLFGAIAHDKGVPDSLRARARQIAGLLGFDAVNDTAPPGDTPASGPSAGDTPAAALQPAASAKP